MKRILKALLALALAFTLAVPVLAAGTELPDAPAQEETPAVPEQPVPDAPEVPIIPEGPAPEVPETPAAPEDPVIPEDPVPEGPEVPETPDGEELPPEEELPIGLEPEEVLIDVIVPSSGHMVINPYRMESELPDGSTSREQIINPAQTLVNMSQVPVVADVLVTAALPPESMARFAAAPPASDEWEKEIFLYVEFQNDPFWWVGWYGDFSNQVLVSDYETFKPEVMTLDPESEGYFRLFGAMTDFPDEMWGEIDVPTVTVTFTFTPVLDDPLPEEPLPEETPEDIPGDVPEDEFVPGDGPEDLPPEDIPEDVPGDVPADIPEDLPGDVPADPPEDVPEDRPEDTPEDGFIPENPPEEEPDVIPGDAPEEAPEEIPEDTPGDAPAEDAPPLENEVNNA